MHRFVSSPSHRLWLAMAATSVLFLSTSARADDSPAAPKASPAPSVEAAKPVSADPPEAQPETAAPVKLQRPASPLMIEMQAVLAGEAEQLAELRQRVRAAATPDEALAIQREIERLKTGTEISLLRVQAKHARKAGRTEVAARIESAIADLVNPPKPLAPAARTAPSREASSH